MKSQPITRELLVACDCGGEVLQFVNTVEFFGPDPAGNTAFNQELHVSFFRYGQVNRKPGLRWRFRQALNVLRTGKPYLDNVILRREGIRKMQEFLTEALESVTPADEALNPKEVGSGIIALN